MGKALNKVGAVPARKTLQGSGSYHGLFKMTFAAVVWGSISLGFWIGLMSARDTLISPSFCLFLYKTDSNTFHFQLYWRRINLVPLLS